MAKALIINSTDQTGGKLQKTLTDVNPDATNAQLLGMAQGLNGLTSNTLVGATLVEKTELGGKSSRNITLANDWGATIQGLNVTIPKSAFTEQKNWLASFYIEGAGVTSAQYSVTLPTLRQGQDTDALGIAVIPTSSSAINDAYVMIQALDASITNLQTGEFKVLVHGDATYEDEVITITVME